MNMALIKFCVSIRVCQSYILRDNSFKALGARERERERKREDMTRRRKME